MYDLKKYGKGDFFGGLNAGIVALPLAMAFGVESGLGATSGLIGAVVLSIIAASVGGTPLLISGPTGVMTVATSLIIATELETAPPEVALTTIFVIFLLAGCFQVVFGLLRFGKYIRFVPYPIISGFMSGIGIIMILIQVLPLIGHPPSIHILEIFKVTVGALQQINWEALLLGIATIIIIYLSPQITKAVPSTLVALVVVSLAAYFFSLRVPTIGDVSEDWITWRWAHLLTFDHTLWKDVIPPAVTIALLGSIDTLLTSLVVDMVSGSNHRSDKELLGQGFGNIVSALAGGLPGSGAIIRSMLSIKSGSKTKVASFIHSAFLLLVLLEIGSVIHYIPFAVLAGILITVGVSIIDYRGLRDIIRIPRSDALVMMVVMFVTVFVGLLPAFAAGIILASLSFVKKMADQNLTRAQPLLLIPESETEVNTVEPIYLSREVFIQELSGPLFFGFASYFKEALQALPHTRAVIFRMERVPFIDQSGLYVLQDVLKQMKRKHIIFYFTGLQDEPLEQLKRMEIIPHFIPTENIFNSFSYAADTLEKFLKDNPSTKLKKTNLKEDLDLKRLNERMN